MATLVLQPTDLAHWHALVSEAEYKNSVILGEELESYLVFLLMRFINKPAVSASVLALDFLNAMHKHGRYKQYQLRDLGDKCLLFAGFFPDLAIRRRIKPSYFSDLGQNAYFVLAGLSQTSESGLYSQLSKEFLVLEKTLASMRPSLLEFKILH